MDFHKKPATGGTGRREIRNLNLAVSVTCCLVETKILGAVGTSDFLLVGTLGAGEPSEEFRTSGITKRFQPWFKRVFGFFWDPLEDSAIPMHFIIIFSLKCIPGSPNQAENSDKMRGA